jgi:tetratricopeptide (TPR) repeat protein
MDPAHGLLMVARLDGPDAAIAGALVDKAMEAETNGLWGRAYFDLRGLTDGPYKKGDQWIGFAATNAISYGFETVIDNKPETFSAGFPMSQIALYAGWYDWNASGPFAQPKVEFMPGAFAYHLHSFGAQTLRSTTNHWCGPLLAKGAAATMGCVDEPYLDGTPNIGIFFWGFLNGFSFGEAAYVCQATLSWQTTVIGDPLYRPFNQAPRTLHESLLARHSPLVEWSHLRFVDLNLAHGAPVAKLVSYLENLDLTKKSAVLTEKLGDLYETQGLPNLAIHAWLQALKLNPSPLQAVRLTLNLGDKLSGSGREDQALELYDGFLKDDPTYPDALALYQKMLPMAKDLHKHSYADRYSAEIMRLTPQPAPAAK